MVYVLIRVCSVKKCVTLLELMNPSKWERGCWNEVWNMVWIIYRGNVLQWREEGREVVYL